MGWQKLEETGKAAYKVCVHTKMDSFASPILHTFSQRRWGLIIYLRVVYT